MPIRNDPYRQWQDEEQEQAGAPEQQAVNQALTGGNQWDPQIQSWYTQYLKRQASPQELQSHYGNPAGLQGIESTIKDSQEAQSVGKMVPSSTQGWGWSPEGQKKTFDYSLPANYSYSPAATRGQYMGQGWMYDRMDNPNDTAMKYLFARAAETIDPTQPGAAAAVAARMKELYGLDVIVNGDVITFPQTGERIDVLRGAQGTPSGYDVWQWMDLNDIDKEQAQAAAASAAGGGQVSALLPQGYNWAGQSPNDLLRMVMSRLALNRVLWDNPMNMRY